MIHKKVKFKPPQFIKILKKVFGNILLFLNYNNRNSTIAISFFFQGKVRMYNSQLINRLIRNKGPRYSRGEPLNPNSFAVDKGKVSFYCLIITWRYLRNCLFNGISEYLLQFDSRKQNSDWELKPN